MAFPRDLKSIDYRWYRNMRKIRSNPNRYGFPIDDGYLGYLYKQEEKYFRTWATYYAE